MFRSRPITVARIGQTRITADVSLLLCGLLLAWLFAPRFADGELNRYLVAATFVLALYTSILLHELAHVLAARLCGLGVPFVALHLLGGETTVTGRQGPGKQALTAVVGPLASAAVGLAAFAGLNLETGQTTMQVLWSLGWINLLIAAFNLVPGLPLDGGRVLAALVWLVTGQQGTGMRAVGWSGRLLSIASLGLAGWLMYSSAGRPTTALMLLLVAVFLWLGSAQAMRSAANRARSG